MTQILRPRFISEAFVFADSSLSAHCDGHTVWVNGNYRITFGWNGEDATDVDLEDYH